MATAGLSTTIEFPIDADKKYAVRPSIEIFPLDSSSINSQYVVRNGEGRSYVVSEKLKNILLLFDGNRTVGEVAEALSVQEGVKVSGEQIQEIIVRYLNRYGLIQEAEEGASDSSPPDNQKRKKPFDFMLRVPLISPSVAAPVVNQLTWLFHPAAAVLAVAAIFLTQIAFYQNWFLARPQISLKASDFLIFYILGLSTALFHEIGHATACKAYKCEHGAIGFLVYLIFPAFYVNLSNAWRLSRKQRAVIDVAGMYFQLLATIPLFLIFLLTGNTYCCAVIYAVDWMVLFSLNPIFKFDGYWLLVDLSGLVNLQKRGLRVVKEIIFWSLGISKSVPVLSEIPGKGKKLLLIMYSFIALAMFTSLILLMLSLAPARVMIFANSLREVAVSPNKGALAVLSSLVKLILNLFFFLFIYRLLNNTVFRLFKRTTWRKTP